MPGLGLDAPPGIILPGPLESRPWLTQQTPPALGTTQPLPQPTASLLGKRNLQPRGWVTGNTSATYRVRYPVSVTGTNVRMTFPAWSTVTAGVGDEPSGNTVTLGECYVEQAGSLYPVTFNGATSVTMDSGGAVTSDIVTGLTVTAGTVFYVRTYVTVPAAGRWPNLYGAYTFPDEVSRPGTNLANATGDLQGTGQSTATLYGPLRVFGDLATGEPYYAITICGDSISAGTNDDFSSEGNVGYWQRALWAPQNTRPFSIVALPGENGTQLLTQGPNRADIVGEYVDYVVNQYGINDLQSGATLAQLQARSFANTVISRNPWVNGRYQQTLGPKSSSTDGWATVANQTPDGIDTARVAFNNWVRDGMPEIGQTAVPVGTVGAIRMGEGGHPYTGYIEVADLCESARDSGRWKAGYTSDGLHPNPTGNAAIAAALDLSVFVDTNPNAAGPGGGGGGTLARDASSPALRSSAFQGAAATQAWDSNSFSPPAGSVIVLVLSATQSFNNAWTTPTITDSLASHLTWTIAASQADVSTGAAQSGVWIAWANCPTAQTGMTVTATYAVAAGQTITFSSVGVEVFTGADTTAPIGATATGVSTTAATAATVTPVGAASALLIAAANSAAASAATSAGTGEYLVEETHVGPSVAIAWYGTATGPTTTGSVQTLDLTSSAAAFRTQYVGFEVKAAPAPTNAAAAASFASGTAYDATVSTGSSGTNAAGDLATAAGTGYDAAGAAGALADVSTAAGAALDASTAAAVLADVATSAGAALDASAALAVTTGPTTGTGAGLDATPAAAIPADVATAAGTGYDATASTVTAANAAADVTSATGTGYDASTALTVTGDQATATVTAMDATAAAGLLADVAAGGGSALDAFTVVAVTGDVAGGTGAGFDATSAIAVTGDVATGTGTGYDAAASTLSAGSAAADVATGTGTALDASTALTATSGVATAAGAGFDATPGVAAAAEVAPGTGSGLDASAAAGAGADVAAGAGGALDASTSTSGSANVAADVAAGAGTALDAASALATTAGLATGTAAAFDATASGVAATVAAAGLAAAAGAALDVAAALAAAADVATAGGSAWPLIPAARAGTVRPGTERPPTSRAGALVVAGHIRAGSQ